MKGISMMYLSTVLPLRLILYRARPKHLPLLLMVKRLINVIGVLSSQAKDHCRNDGGGHDLQIPQILRFEPFRFEPFDLRPSLFEPQTSSH